MNPATLLLCGFATGATIAFLLFLRAVLRETPQKEDEP